MAKVKIIGVGCAGIKVVERLKNEGRLKDTSYVAFSPYRTDLLHSNVDERVWLAGDLSLVDHPQAVFLDRELD